MRPMIFTTNKALSAWGRVLHDDDLANVIIDRIPLAPRAAAFRSLES